jgi:branched-chain amino acid transport system substrate-binding protein
MKFRRLLTASCITIIAAGALAACSSSGSSTSAGAGSSSAKDIVIGTIGSYTNIGSTIGPSRDVIEAWASEVNAAGGVNGHHIKLIVKDDGLDPAKALAAAKELVARDKVVAIVGEMSLLDSVWANYVEAAGVPVIGGQSFGNPMATKKNFFPSGTNSIARSYGELNESLKQHGPKFGVLYCAEAPVCKTGSDIFGKLASGLNMKIAPDTSVSGTAPNYTAQCQAIKDANAGAVAVGQGSPIALRIINQCAQQGVKAVPVSSGGIANSSFLSSSATNGLINIELDFPYFDSSTPATKAYQALQTKYHLDSQSGASGTYAYAGAKLFEAAATAVGSSPVTSDSLMKALYAMKDETLGGLTPPLTFNQDGPTLINCYFVDTIESGKWTLPYQLKPQCAPDAAVTSALSEIK